MTLKVWNFSVGVLPAPVISQERNLCVWWGFPVRAGYCKVIGAFVMLYDVWSDVMLSWYKNPHHQLSVSRTCWHPERWCRWFIGNWIGSPKVIQRMCEY